MFRNWRKDELGLNGLSFFICKKLELVTFVEREDPKKSYLVQIILYLEVGVDKQNS